MAIKLIIFDLDGTLVDSSTDIANALNAASKPFDIPPVTVREAEEIIGGGLKKLIKRLLAKSGSTMDGSLLLQRFLEEYSSHLTDHTRPYEALRETLEALDGITKAILSNKLTSFTIEIVRRFGLTHFFSSIQGGDVVVEKKPAPTSVLALLAQFGVDKKEAMIVGDSSYDVEAGHRAGIHTVAAMYGYGVPGFEATADYRITSLSELPGIVFKLL
jgi:phosphoglycolate phosphatase